MWREWSTVLNLKNGKPTCKKKKKELTMIEVQKECNVNKKWILGIEQACQEGKFAQLWKEILSH